MFEAFRVVFGERGMETGNVIFPGAGVAAPFNRRMVGDCTDAKPILDSAGDTNTVLSFPAGVVVASIIRCNTGVALVTAVVVVVLVAVVVAVDVVIFAWISSSSSFTSVFEIDERSASRKWNSDNRCLLQVATKTKNESVNEKR